MRYPGKAGIGPFWACLLLSAFTVLFPSLGLGQMVNASLTGRVTDPTGAAIPDASVTATDVATGKATKTMSGPTGDYTIPSLMPATYSVTVEKEGFKTYVESGITLLVDQHARLDAQLQVGNVSTRVEVSGSAQMVETNSASVGTVIGERDVVDLPLNLRRFGALATLVPGTTTDNGGFANNQFGSPFSEASYTANGARSASNNSIIDGVDSRNMTFGGFSVSPPPDAVQEFKVQTNIYDAAFGKTAGSTINLVTKGGTNEYHGALYEFVRNNIFDSPPYFQKTLPEYRRNQYGGSIGGPIIKNKLFWFVNYEELRQIQGGNSNTIVPTAAQLQGDFSHKYDGSSAFTGNTVNLCGSGGPANAVLPGGSVIPLNNDTGQLFDPSTSVLYNCPNAKAGAPPIVIAQPIPNNILFGTGISRTMDPVAAHALSFNPFPAPNLSGVAGANFVQAAPLPLTQHQGDVRIDWSIGPRDQFMGRYLIGNSYAVNPYSGYNILPTFGDTIYFRGQNLALGWTHTFGGHLLNEAHFGFQRDYDIANCESCPRAAGFQEGFGIQNFTSVSPSFEGFPIFSFNNFSGIGDSNYRPVISPDMVEKYQDNLTWTKGRHTFVFGADLQFYQILSEAASFAPHGQFYFNGQYSSLFGGSSAALNSTADMADFLLGYPNNAASTIKYTNTNQTGGGFWNVYAQDNFKVSNNLTVNLGIRWEDRRWATDKRDNYLTLWPTAPLFSGPGDALLISALPAAQNDALCTNTYYSYLWATNPDGSVRCLIATNAQRSSFGFTGRTAQTLIKPDNTNFAPRVGIAWRPTGSDKMVIRTGYGIFYDTPNMNNQHFVNNNPVFSPSQYFFTNSGAVPTATTANVFGGSGGIPNINSQFVSLFVSPNYKAPYVQQWSFGFASQLSKNWAIDLSYIGAKGTHLGDLHLPGNQAEPGTGPLQARRPYPDFGTMLYTDPSADSNYNSLQFKVTRRFANGLSFLAAYTYAKSLDDNEGDEGFGGGRGNGNAQDDNRMWLDYGRSFTDARNRLVLSYIYELPFGRGKKYMNTGGAANAILGGWQVSGVTTFQAGFPFTVTSSGIYSNTGSATPRPDRTCFGNGPKTISQWFGTNCFTTAPLLAANAQGIYLYGNSGRNILSGPGLQDWDFLAMKRFSIGERLKFELRFEFYNLFNTPNFNYPNTNIDGSAFGVINNTNGPARQIQFGAKMNF